MSVSRASATYRIRVSTAGATSIGTPALTLTQADISTVPILSGPSVDLLAGTATSHPFQLQCIVDSPILTSTSNRLAVLGRLCEVQRALDGSTTYSTVGTGRISHVSEVDTRGGVTVEVSDERWVERRTEIFRTTDSIQLYPTGLASAFMDQPAAGTAAFTVVEVSGQAYRVQPGVSAILNPAPVPQALCDALAADLLRNRTSSATNSTGNFTSLRFNDGSGDRVVISFQSALTGVDTRALDGSGLLGSLAPGEAGALFSAWIYHNGHGHSVNDQITGKFHFPSGIQISEKIPLLIGGANGIHPMTLLKDILDGDYGGQAVLYDSTAMTALTSLSLRRVWVRLTKPAERSAWLAKNIYSVYNVAPLVGTDLVSRPTALRLPINTDPDTLEVLTAANAEVGPWEHTTRELATVVAFKSKSVRPLSLVANTTDDFAADYLTSIDVIEPDIEHDTVSTLGEVVHEIDTDLIFEPWRTRFNSDVADELAVELFDVFGDGPVRGSVPVLGTVTAQVGDLVVLDQDTLKGFNPGTGGRTGDRIVRLVGFRELHPTHTVFDWVDLGPKSSPLDAPTVAIAQSTSDQNIVNVTVSSLNAGEAAIVEAVVGTTAAPTQWDYVRADVGNETVAFNIGPAEGTAWGRARATAPGRIRSAWATDSVTLATRAKLEKATVYKSAGGATVEWTVGSTSTQGVRATYDAHERGASPTLANQTDYQASAGGFSISGVPTRQQVTVKLVPYTGWNSTGGAVSGSSGEPIVTSALFPRTGTGGAGVPTVRNGRTSIRTTFDANGEAVVSVVAPEEAVAVYVTVGDGTDPSDPTVASNDGSVTGPSGTVATSVAITTGNDAHVKAVWKDSYGNLSAVSSEKAARRLGPLHHDATTRSHTGDTSETTLQEITIPGGTLGTNGVVRLTAQFLLTIPNNTGQVFVRLNGTGSSATLATASFAATASVRVRVQVELFNKGSASAQRGINVVSANDGTVSVATGDATHDSASDMTIQLRGRVLNSSDTVTLETSLAEFAGTK